EQGRTLEALEAITDAAARGGDPFFISAIRGDIYAEMERHNEAADAYDQALEIEPDDHWALHQAALEHGFAGHTSRASELFEAALKNDRDGCHQTLVDYGDFERLCMLWSIGKDSTVLLWLARKAFFGHVPFPLVHIDTSYKLPEMIAYRDRLAREYKLQMVVGQDSAAIAAGRTFPATQHLPDGHPDKLSRV